MYIWKITFVRNGYENISSLNKVVHFLTEQQTLPALVEVMHDNIPSGYKIGTIEYIYPEGVD